MAKAFRLYYILAKPGIVYGNALHIVAGSLLAYQLGFTFAAFAGVLVGTSLVIASACVANNLIDRDIDKQMKRTSTRPSVTGEVDPKWAIVYLVGLFAAGMMLLVTLTNYFVALIGLVAYIMYVFVYGYAKRKTVHSTLVGSIPGALPAMAGYVAITSEITMAAWLIFLLVVLWQMPHFYAISIFRRKEYAKANLPVLGVMKGNEAVRKRMTAYTLAYVVCIIAMIVLDVFTIVGGILLLAAALYWLKGMVSRTNDYEKWARKNFFVSLQVSLVFVIASAFSVVIA